jgi:hypothetical protein
MDSSGFLRQFVAAVCDLHARGLGLPASGSKEEARAQALDDQDPRAGRKFRMACRKASAEKAAAG